MTQTKELHLKQLELSALLEITQAINANMPEEALYRIYHFTLITNLQVSKLALFVLDDHWNCKVNFGTKESYKEKTLPEALLGFKKITSLEVAANGFEEFDTVVPILHKDKALAFVLLGGMNELRAKNAEPDLSFLQTISSILIVAVENKKLARKELQQESFRKEMEIAREVQSLLFPKKLPANNLLAVKAGYYPHHTIGGDYYDFIPLGQQKYILCIGDVSGKGIPAALLMSNFQASLRTLIRKTTDLAEIISELNHIILNNANGEKFITFFIALLDLENKQMQYINAGHNPPLMVDKNKNVTLLENGTTLLGVFPKLPFINVQSESLGNHQLIFAYTDGVTDVSNKAQMEFGPDRLKDFIQEHCSDDLESLHKELYQHLDTYREGTIFPDDITFISCYLK